MAAPLIKQAITFSVDRDELGWLQLQANRIGKNRSQILQSLIERAAEIKDGDDWREAVREFVASQKEEASTAA